MATQIKAGRPTATPAPRFPPGFYKSTARRQFEGSTMDAKTAKTGALTVGNRTISRL